MLVTTEVKCYYSPTIYTELTSMDLAEWQDQINLQVQRNLRERERLSKENVQKLFSRKALEQNFLECFELVGGVPRLALWANDPENYGEFLKLLMKFAPKEAEKAGSATIHFLSSIPDSPLNNPQPDHERPAIDHDSSLPESI